MDCGIQYIPKEIITEEMMELAINADSDRIQDHDEMVKEQQLVQRLEHKLQEEEEAEED